MQVQQQRKPAINAAKWSTQVTESLKILPDWNRNPVGTHLVEEMVVPFAFLLIAHADLHLKNVWSRVTSKALLESRTWRSQYISWKTLQNSKLPSWIISCLVNVYRAQLAQPSPANTSECVHHKGGSFLLPLRETLHPGDVTQHCVNGQRMWLQMIACLKTSKNTYCDILEIYSNVSFQLHV